MEDLTGRVNPAVARRLSVPGIHQNPVEAEEKHAANITFIASQSV